MGKLTIHPLALKYPPIAGMASSELSNSLKKNGQLHPITVLGNQILDGRSRYEHLVRLGMEPITVPYRGKTDPQSLADFVRASNEHRRHLTASQRTLIELEIEEFVRETEGAKLRSHTEIAEAARVSERTVDMAAKVHVNGSAAVIAAVKDDEVSVNDAAAIADLPKGQQNKALGRVREGKANTLREAAKKQGRQKQDPRLWSQWDSQFAKLKRMTDDLGREFPNTRAHRAVTYSLNQAMDQKELWMASK